MESHPKVMTVSYGTFACTLQGFDDPFTTMQLVAEYFRKLSSQDRYFGGEPLQPDVDKLHQIAKDANPYSVDAERTQSGVTFSKAPVYEAGPELDAVPTKANDLPVAEFKSKRGGADVPAKFETSQKDVAQPSEDANDSFVQAAMFSSRRSALTAAQNEPAQSTAEMLAEADLPVASDSIDGAEDDANLFIHEPTPPVDVAQPAPEPQNVAVSPEPTEPENAPQDVAETEIDNSSLASNVAAAMDALAKPEPAAPAVNAPEPQNIPEAIAQPSAAPTTDVAEGSGQGEPQEELPVVAEQIDQDVEQSDKQSDDIQREEEALERLLETTNTKLDAESLTRRSNSLERLKAAVAATEAERRARAPATDENGRTVRPNVRDLGGDANAFKQRLAEVRSDHEKAAFTRPKTTGSASTRRSKIATLILGNDQRIASNAAEAAAPAKKLEDSGTAAAAFQDASSRTERPKPELTIISRAATGSTKVSAEAPRTPNASSTPTARPMTAPKQATGFEAFAQNHGAYSLPELLQASAAYLVISQDEPRFTQDRLMENLGDYLLENNISEDATHRTLNRLLRDGKLLRVKRDWFTISKSARHAYQDQMAG